MAEAADIERLKSGEADMSHCDLSNADLSGYDLSGRDFTGANCSGIRAKDAKFINCVFEKTTIVGLQAQGADFSGAVFARVPFTSANFSGAAFRGTKVHASALIGIDLSGADLRGADFTASHFIRDVDLSSATYDESTIFENVRMMRSMASQPIFENYRFEDGRLFRREGAPRPVPSDPSLEVAKKQAAGSVWGGRDIEILRELRSIKGELARVRDVVDQLGSIEIAVDDPEIGIGHNGPPSEAVLTLEDVEEASSALVVIEQQVDKRPDKHILRVCHFLLRKASSLFSWAATQGKIFMEEAVKAAGARAGERVIDLVSLKAALLMLATSFAGLAALIAAVF